MTRREFEKVVEEAISSLPEKLRRKIENVQFRVAESPSRRQAGGGRQPALYGLYEGVPYGQRGPDYAMAMPDRITVFKRAIERDFPTRAKMIKGIQETVLHEIGHYFGFDDAQLDDFGIG